MKKIWQFMLLASAIGLVGWLGPGILSHHEKTPLSKPPEHGTSFLLEADFSQIHGDPAPFQTLENALQKRLSPFGIRLFFEPVSPSQARLVLPITDSDQVERARRVITQEGNVEFRQVYDHSADLVQANRPLPPGYELFQYTESDLNGRPSLRKIVVKKKAEIAGHLFKNARLLHDNFGNAQIEFELNADSAVVFAKVTRDNIGHQLAIVIDGVLYSAPQIVEPIETGAGVITGHYSQAEAQTLTTVLTSALPVSIKILEEKTY